ncbi:MAG TPA: LCP family protein [Pseudonocardiaceae bacterium]
MRRVPPPGSGRSPRPAAGPGRAPANQPPTPGPRSRTHQEAENADERTRIVDPAVDPAEETTDLTGLVPTDEPQVETGAEPTTLLAAEEAETRYLGPAGSEADGDDSEADPEPAESADDGAEPPTGRGRARTGHGESGWRRAGRRLGKGVAATAALAVLATTGVAWGAKEWANDQIQKVRALDPDSEHIQQREQQLGDENFLLIGSDSRAGAQAGDNIGTEAITGGPRSDTTMIAHIPADRSRIVVVSFPRDLEINRPACEEWDHKAARYTGKQVPPEKNVKLNSAYLVGGPLCVTKVVQEISGLAINHFMGIDFNGFKGMVDAIGGVEVCIEKPMIDAELGPIFPEPGLKVLFGNDSLNYVRARKLSNDPTSDYGRMKRQQRFLSALLRKVMSSQVLLDPGKLTGFISEVGKHTFGENVDADQLLELAQSLRHIQTGRVTFVTVPTTGTANGRGNEELRVEDTKALFTAIIEGTPLPGEQPPSDGDSPAPQAQPEPGGGGAEGPLVDPKNVKVQVLNGSSRGGLARSVSEKLGDLGFVVVRQGNAPEQSAKTVIRYSATRAAEARTLAAAVPSAELQEDPSMGGAVVLVLGADFDDEIVNPSKGGDDAENAQEEELPADLSTVNAAEVTAACS